MRIQIDQQAVVTRTAFRATLTVTNTTAVPLEQFNLSLDIRNQEGVASNFQFLTSSPIYSGAWVTQDSSGLGVIGAAADSAHPAIATVEWLFLPADTAAPTADPRRYTFGGTVSHLENGIPIALPLFPVPVDVYPDAKLFLRYYLQNPVIGDSPFTAGAIEASEPFTMGLMVRNAGLGEARNFRITSAQPIITENISGLLVNFQLIGAQLGNVPVTPCLTLPFGDIDPGVTKVGRWLMTSSLQGFFTDYHVTFEHTNPAGFGALASQETSNLGKTSLIHDARIFETTHTVRLTGPGQDDQPDFLVRAHIGDPANDCDPGVTADCGSGTFCDPMPTEIHVSDGQSVLQLQRITTATFDGPPTLTDVIVNMTVDTPGAGWTLIRAEDPSLGEYTLASVKRVLPGGGRTLIPVGGPGDITNAWTTHRWLPLNCTNPHQVHQIYVLDQLEAAGPQAYELTYAPALTVSEVQINSTAAGAIQRSNITDVRVYFTANTNIPALIANGQLPAAVTLHQRGPNGTLNQIPLSLSRFSWDGLGKTLLIKLTTQLVNGAAGPGLETILPDGNFVLALRTDLITSPDGLAALHDTDGRPDGLQRFGDHVSDGFYRYLGDITGAGGLPDRRINKRDFTSVIQAYGSTSSLPGWNPNCDLNHDGAIGRPDVWRLRPNWLDALPFN